MPDSDERKFLHDVSSPLAAAIFSVDLLLEEMEGNPVDKAAALKLLARITGSLDDVRTRIEKRREVVKKRRGAEK